MNKLTVNYELSYENIHKVTYTFKLSEVPIYNVDKDHLFDYLTMLYPMYNVFVINVQEEKFDIIYNVEINNKELTEIIEDLKYKNPDIYRGC